MWWPFQRKVTDGGVTSPQSTVSVSESEGPPPRQPSAPPPPAPALERPTDPAPQPDPQPDVTSLEKHVHALEVRLSRVVSSLRSQGLSVPGRWPDLSDDQPSSPEPTFEAPDNLPPVLAGRRVDPSRARS